VFGRFAYKRSQKRNGPLLREGACARRARPRLRTLSLVLLRRALACRYPLDAHVEANAVEEARCLAKVEQLLAGDQHIAGCDASSSSVFESAVRRTAFECGQAAFVGWIAAHVVHILAAAGVRS
jgi:hypothetical protein